MKTYIQIVDSFLALVLFGPLVAAFWRGTWGLANIYVFPNDPLISSIVSLAAGLGVYLLAAFLQDKLIKLNSNWNTLVFCVFSRIFSYVLSWAIVLYWRGVWGLLDLTGITVISASLTTGISAFLLIVFRGLSNTVSPPLGTLCDLGREDYFRITTIFKTKLEPSLKFYADVSFSVVIIVALVVSLWRGVWTLMDLFLVPDDPFLSAWLSLVTGNVLAIVLFVLQWPLMYTVKQIKTQSPNVLKKYALLGMEDVMSMFGMVAATFIWRGFWYLQDQRFLVENAQLSNWVSHLIAVVCGVFLSHYNAFMQSGLAPDGDVINSGEPIFFNTKFIANFIEHSQKTPSGATTSKTADQNPSTCSA